MISPELVLFALGVATSACAWGIKRVFDKLDNLSERMTKVETVLKCDTDFERKL